MLQNWNTALTALHPAVQHPDTARELVLFGESFRPEDKAGIPEADLPAGLPKWMSGGRAWADRKGETAAKKRATIVVTVPRGIIPS
jgi:hypothetical protein